MDTPDRLEEGVMRRNAWILLEMIKKLSSATDEKDLESEHIYTKNMLKNARTELEKAFWDQKINAMQAEKNAFYRAKATPEMRAPSRFPSRPRVLSLLLLQGLKTAV